MVFIIDDPVREHSPEQRARVFEWWKRVRGRRGFTEVHQGPHRDGDLLDNLRAGADRLRPRGAE